MNCAARNPAGCPRGLKIEPAGDAVNVQHLAGEKQSGANPAFHRLEIHFVQPHAAAGDKFILVQAFAGHRKFRAEELLDEPVLRRADSAAQRVSRAMPAASTSCSHSRDGSCASGVLTMNFAGCEFSPRLKFRRNLLRVQAAAAS